MPPLPNLTHAARLRRAVTSLYCQLVLLSFFTVCAVSHDAGSCSAGPHALLQVTAHGHRRPSVGEQEEPSDGEQAQPYDEEMAQLYAAEQEKPLEREADFKVLVVGAPRTGTQSMRAALTRLGFNPQHSGQNSSVRMPWCNYLFGLGSFQEAMETMIGFDSAMDEPFHLLYEEVVERYPNCKFILTESDPERWYSSCQSFMSHHIESEPAPLIADPFSGLSFDRQVSDQCQHLHYFSCNFTATQTPELKRRCIQGYKDHSARVRSIIPAERLLVFNLSQGYPPLAAFLNTPVPDEPFPYEDHFNPSFVSS